MMYQLVPSISSDKFPLFLLILTLVTKRCTTFRLYGKFFSKGQKMRLLKRGEDIPNIFRKEKILRRVAEIASGNETRPKKKKWKGY